MPWPGSLRAGFGAIRRAKRLLALAALGVMLVGLPAALYVGRVVDSAGSRRTDSTEIARRLDLDFFADVRARAAGFDENLTALVVGAAVLFFVLHPLLLGGYVGIAAQRRRITFSQFVREGGAVYWKFLRLALLQVLCMYLLALAAKPLLGLMEDYGARELREDAALSYVRGPQIVVFAGFCVLGLVFDYARVGIRMRRRPGVLAELGRSASFVLQHPLRTVALYGAGLLLEIAALVVFAALLQIADGAYLITSAAMLVLGQLLVMAREAARLFHLAGAWHIRNRIEGEERPEALGRGAGDEPDLLRAPLPWHAR